MIVDIINLKPQQLEDLCISAGSSGNAGDQICAALTKANITTLKEIALNDCPNCFASEEQCTAWAAVLNNQTNLKKLRLRDCNVSGTREATIRAACPNTDIEFYAPDWM